jgi:hypothetical protein
MVQALAIEPDHHFLIECLLDIVGDDDGVCDDLGLVGRNIALGIAVLMQFHV